MQIARSWQGLQGQSAMGSGETAWTLNFTWRLERDSFKWKPVEAPVTL